MRLKIGLCLVPLLLAAATVAALELKQADWPNRVIELEAAEDGIEPPVVTALGLQPGGKLMASAGDDHRVRIWNRDTGELIIRLEGHIDWIRTASFTPDGNQLITAGNDRQIYRWDVHNNWQRTLLAEHDQAIVAVAIHPTGDQLAVVGFDGQLQVYSMAGETLATWGCPCQDMRTVVYSPTGEQLAAAGRNGKIRIWNSATGEELQTIRAHRQRIRALVYSADGSQLISAGEDRQIKAWQPVTGQELFALSSAPAKVQSLALFGEGKLASAGSDNRIRLWDLDTLTSSHYLHGHTGSVAVMESDGDVLISGAYDATVRVWQIAAGELIASETTSVSIEQPVEAVTLPAVTDRFQPAAETVQPNASRYQPAGDASQPSGSRYQPVGRD